MLKMKRVEYSGLKGGFVGVPRSLLTTPPPQEGAFLSLFGSLRTAMATQGVKIFLGGHANSIIIYYNQLKFTQSGEMASWTLPQLPKPSSGWIVEGFFPELLTLPPPP